MVKCPKGDGGTLWYNANTGFSTCNVCMGRWFGRPEKFGAPEGAGDLQENKKVKKRMITKMKCPIGGHDHMLAADIKDGKVFGRPYCAISGTTFTVQKKKGILSVTEAITEKFEGYGKGVRSRLLEAAIFFFLAIVFSIGTPAILGIPSFRPWFIVTALILWGAHVMLPSQYEILEKARKKEGEVTLENEHIGLAYAKSFLKIFAMIFVVLEFIPPFGSIQNNLIATVILFVEYFSLPSRYLTNQPAKASEAWLRTMFGIFLSLSFFFLFTPNFNLGQGFLTALFFVFVFVGLMVVIHVAIKLKWLTIIVGLALATVGIPVVLALAPAFLSPGFSLFFLSMAFFVIFPTREKPKDEKVTVIGMGKGLSDYIKDNYDKWEELGNGVFLGFAIAAATPVIGSLIGVPGVPGQLALIIALIWVMSIAIGLTAGREGRPYIGIIVLVFSLFAFSLSYSETVGVAFFGPYYGTVSNFFSATLGPVGDALGKTTCEATASYACITEGPAVCQAKRLECQKRIATAEGSQQAIEIVTVNFQPKEASNTIDTIGYVEIENKGDWDATDVELSVKDPRLKRPGTPSKEKGSVVGSAIINSCIGGRLTADEKGCKFEGMFAKFDTVKGRGGKGAMQFMLDWTDLKEYDSGLFPDVTFVTKFNYDVSSTYSIDARSEAEIKRLLQEGQTIGTIVARYSGGPIMASLWTPNYLQENTAASVTATLTNMGNGKATENKYCVYLPNDVETVKEDAKGRTLPWNGVSEDETACPILTNMKTIFCNLGIIEKSGYTEEGRLKDSKSCSFWIKVSTGGQPQKRLDIVGTANYTYAIERTKKEVIVTGISAEKTGVAPLEEITTGIITP